MLIQKYRSCDERVYMYLLSKVEALIARLTYGIFIRRDVYGWNVYNSCMWLYIYGDHYTLSWAISELNGSLKSETNLKIHQNIGLYYKMCPI